jgi:hypothetical protein
LTLNELRLFCVYCIFFLALFCFSVIMDLMKHITPKQRMAIFKEMAKTQPAGFTWEAFKRMLGSNTMLGSQVRSQAKRILKNLDNN